MRLDIATCEKITISLNSERAAEVLIIYKASIVATYALSIPFSDILSSWLVLDSELAANLSLRARKCQGGCPVQLQLSHFINKIPGT